MQESWIDALLAGVAMVALLLALIFDLIILQEVWK